MTTFHTPEPISSVIEVAAGAVHLAASDRDDTVVEIRPRDPDRASDVRAAEQARVDYRNGTLTVAAGPKFISLGRGGAVHIDIALPAASRLKVSTASATIEADGLYSECQFASASGNVVVATVEGNLKADSASGDITVDDLVGDAVISTASGKAALGRVEGDVTFKAASGGIDVGELRGNAKAQTASGPVRVAVAAGGAVTAFTSSGDVEVGIPQGTAARLELDTRSGTVSNGLQAADGPGDGEQTMVIHARTGSGDISVSRAAGSTPAGQPA